MRSSTAPAAPRRWRRRRVARIAVAVALVVAAPFVGRADPETVPGGARVDDPALAADPDTAPGDRPRSPGDHTRVRVVPIPLADPAVAELLAPGDLVDLVGTADPASPGGPQIVARAARVRDTPAGRGGTRTILVEVPQAEAARVAATAAGSPLAVLVYG